MANNDPNYKCQANWSASGWLLNAYADDPKETIDLVKQMKAELDPTPEEAPQEAPKTPTNDDLLKGAIPLCPTHKIEMVKRHNRTTNEPFWGCSEYPKCREQARVK